MRVSNLFTNSFSLFSQPAVFGDTVLIKHIILSEQKNSVKYSAAFLFYKWFHLIKTKICFSFFFTATLIDECILDQCLIK